MSRVLYVRDAGGKLQKREISKGIWDLLGPEPVTLYMLSGRSKFEGENVFDQDGYRAISKHLGSQTAADRLERHTVYRCTQLSGMDCDFGLRRSSMWLSDGCEKDCFAGPGISDLSDAYIKELCNLRPRASTAPDVMIFFRLLKYKLMSYYEQCNRSDGRPLLHPFLTRKGSEIVARLAEMQAEQGTTLQELVRRKRQVGYD